MRKGNHRAPDGDEDDSGESSIPEGRTDSIREPWARAQSRDKEVSKLTTTGHVNENNEPLGDATNGTKESRRDGTSCRNDVPRVAEDSGLCTRPTRVFSTEQVVRDMPNIKQREVYRGRGGYYTERIFTQDQSNHVPACKGFLMDKCERTRRLCKCRHVHQEGHGREKAEQEKRCGGNY